MPIEKDELKQHTTEITNKLIEDASVLLINFTSNLLNALSNIATNLIQEKKECVQDKTKKIINENKSNKKKGNK